MTTARWQQLNCHCNKQFQEAISNYMEERGALSITFQDAGDTPVLEPLPGETPLWDDLVVTALFDGSDDLSPILNFLKDAQQKWKISRITSEKIKDQDWERVWMDDFHPMQFGNNLWIYPSWSEVPVDDSVKIVLDPGLAFGSGTHPTTSLCLEWLDANPPVNCSVIDYGCGSGILAIAASKLGATEIIATDIDEQALIATRDNINKNNIEEASIPSCFPEELPDAPVDLLIANILSGPLASLESHFANLIKPGGRIVLSGILAEQADNIVMTYQRNFTDLSVSQKGDWIRVTGKRST